MEKSYQQIIIDLIERLYTKPKQEAAKKVLIAYFTQEPEKRKLTLKELGKQANVTREDARQVKDKFTNKIFPAELQKFEGKFESENSIDLETKKDLQRLRKALEIIVDEINLFDRPVFTKYVQHSLQNKGMLDQDICIPVVIDLIKSFGIKTDFKIEEINEIKIIVNKDDEIGKYTTGVIKYAKNIARHCGGLFSVGKLLDPSWNIEAPKSIQDIPPGLRKKFILDILHTDPSLLLLQNSEFYAFRGDDERFSSILVPIFYAYKNPLGKSILISSVQRVLKCRLSGEQTYLNVLDSANLAIDDYCRRTLLIDVEGMDYRVPGLVLREKIKNYQPKKIYGNQMRILEMIRANGEPVDSDSFGNHCTHELNIPKSQWGLTYTYPALYYKDGGGRRHDLYKTLDGNYNSLVNQKAENNYVSDAVDSRIKALKEKINKLRIELENLDVVSEVKIKSRAEQNSLRELLILLSPKAKTTTDHLAARCQICSKYYPNQLLVAAHVKPRVKCNPEEKADIENIAMLQCKSCDALFGNGFISVKDDGIVIANIDIPRTDDLIELLSRVEGNSCDYLNGNKQRAAYMEYHRDHVFSKFGQENL